MSLELSPSIFSLEHRQIPEEKKKTNSQNMYTTVTHFYSFSFGRKRVVLLLLAVFCSIYTLVKTDQGTIYITKINNKKCESQQRASCIDLLILINDIEPTIVNSILILLNVNRA